MLIRGTGRPDGYYLADGRRVPSVTTITGARKMGIEGLLAWANQLGREGKSHREARQAAADAGSLAHTMVENAIHGRDPMEGIPPVEASVLEQAKTGYGGFVRWNEIMALTYLETEVPMVSEQERYGGTPDAIARSKEGRLLLLDWKSSNAVYGDYIIQLAAYGRLWNSNHEEGIQEYYLLRFGKQEGDFHFHSYPPNVIEKAWLAFLHLRALYDLDKELKKVAT